MVGTEHAPSEAANATRDPGAGLLGDRVLLALVLAGLALRLGVAFAAWPDRTALGDEAEYFAVSERIARTGELETGHFVRPPLYFLILAGIRMLPGPFLPAVFLLQGLASVATGVLAYRTARRLGSRRAARIAAAFLLLHPTLIAYAHLLWPETFFLLGVSLLFDQLTDLRPERAGRSVALGALTGLCMLLKPVFGLFTPVLALWWVRRFGWTGAARLAVVFGLATAVVIAPWVVRNQLRYGGSILLEDQAAYNLWIGNSPRPAAEVLQAYLAIPDPAERAREGFARGLEAIEAAPGRFAGLYLRRIVNLWGLEFLVVRNAIYGGYGSLSDATMLAVFWTLQAGQTALWLAAALGLGVWPRGSVLFPIAAHAALFTAVVAVMIGTTRFAVPFAFLLAVSAGLGLDAPRRAWRERRGRAAVAVALAILAVSATRPVFRPFLTGESRATPEQALEWYFFRY